jgi:hypothetical protein
VNSGWWLGIRQKRENKVPNCRVCYRDSVTHRYIYSQNPQMVRHAVSRLVGWVEQEETQHLVANYELQILVRRWGRMPIKYLQ